MMENATAMSAVLVGLRFAVTAMFAVILLHWARDPAERSMVDRLRYMAIALVAIGIVLEWAPLRMWRLFGLSLPGPADDLVTAAAMLAMIGAAMLLIAVRGLRMGGTKRNVKIGAATNAALVVLCVACAEVLR